MKIGCAEADTSAEQWAIRQLSQEEGISAPPFTPPSASIPIGMGTRQQTGPGVWLRSVAAQARAATIFVGLYTVSARKNERPASTRLEPAY